ncbi:MAG: hypothetical protein AAF530_18485 [Pseudomonadota bacterium]
MIDQPRTIKTAFVDAWAISDSAAGFSYALQERGYKLARGDRRDFVAVDLHGEVYSVPRRLFSLQAEINLTARVPATTEGAFEDVSRRLGATQEFEAWKRFARTKARNMCHGL